MSAPSDELDRLWRGWQQGDRSVHDALVSTALRHHRGDVLRALEAELLPEHLANATWTAVRAGLSRGQRLSAMRWSPDGAMSVARVGAGDWFLRDEATATWRGRLTWHGTPHDVRLTNDWLILSNAEHGRGVVALDTTRGEPLEFPPGPLAIHPGGRACVGLGHDRRLYHHALPDGHLLSDAWRPPGRIQALAFSDDGRRLVGSMFDPFESTQVLLVWDWPELRSPRQIPVGGLTVHDLHVSRDGARAAMLVTRDVVVIDLDRGEAIADPPSPTRGALHLALSPWGALVLTASGAHLELCAPDPVHIDVATLATELPPTHIGDFDPHDRDLAVRGRAESEAPRIVALDQAPDGTLRLALDDGWIGRIGRPTP